LLENELHETIFFKKRAQNNRTGSARAIFVSLGITVCVLAL
jgi:hypothetical protein